MNRDIEGFLVTIEDIKESFSDPEVAHQLEDQLYKDVLVYLFLRSLETNYSAEDTDLLTKVLEVVDLPFPRWYA